MARSLTSGIAGQLTVSGAFAGWLMEITTTGGSVLRYTSLDINFAYGGFTWLALDMEPPDLSWDGSALRSAQITIGDADLVFWALALQLSLTNAKIRLWQCYAGATNEAEPVFSGRIGRIARRGASSDAPSVQLSVSNMSDKKASPSTRVQYVVNPAFLLPSGTVLNISGQRWILDRPVTAN